VAYRLCERALVRYSEAGVRQVFCDVQSAGMKATLDRLARERPDLGALIRARLDCGPGEGLEFEDAPPDEGT
jgi:hypothetical protein